MGKKSKKAYTAPTILEPRDGDDESLIRVVIETPKGSGNKYAFDAKLGAFKLRRALPEGMVFPYDFGFVPSTQGNDGDPVDVLLLMDQPAFPGCVVESRLIGVIEGEQIEDGKAARNDRLIAVAAGNRIYSDLKKISDMNKVLLRDIGQFFVNYHRLGGSKFKVLRTKGPKEANRLLTKAIGQKRVA